MQDCSFTWYYLETYIQFGLGVKCCVADSQPRGLGFEPVAPLIISGIKIAVTVTEVI